MSSAVIRMSWNWLRDVLQGRAFDLSEGARQDFHFYVDKSEKMSAFIIHQHQLYHTSCSTLKGFEQTQSTVDECIKYSILLCPKSIKRVFTWNNLCHIVQTHRKPNSYLIPGSWCVCDKARNLVFSFLVFRWAFTKNSMKTKNVKNKDNKVFKTEN